MTDGLRTLLAADRGVSETTSLAILVGLAVLIALALGVFLLVV